MESPGAPNAGKQVVTSVPFVRMNVWFDLMKKQRTFGGEQSSLKTKRMQSQAHMSTYECKLRMGPCTGVSVVSSIKVRAPSNCLVPMISFDLKSEVMNPGPLSKVVHRNSQVGIDAQEGFLLYLP